MKTRSIAMVFVALALAAPLFAAEEVVKHESRAAVSAASLLRVEVQIPVGEVTLRTAEVDKIEAVATFSRHDESEDPARDKAIVNASEIAIDVSGSRAIVRTKYGAAADTFYARHHPSDLKVTITMPARRHIEMNQRVGDVTLDGWFGNVDIELSVGEVNVTAPKKSVRQLSASSTIGEVTTNIGDRTVTKEGVLAGRTDYLNESGESTMRITVRVGEIKVTLH